MTLAEKLRKHHLILNSGSPRRQQFLRDLRLDFEIRLQSVEEVYPKNLSVEEVVDYLAELKAQPFQEDLASQDILITGDTVVAQDDHILGKPESTSEAFSMLHRLSGKSHKVLSSVCLKSIDKTEVFHETTQVFFKELTHDEINFYIENFKPFDKAGAYGIQEWIGKIGVEKIEGSFYNVMGMPLDKVYSALMNF